ncbi:hypothetical protein RND71_002117 [Anisodus tanguticus]|uniref:Uncharacterized protein n=1 Tax=Anisodus tanguticus TaxID=243964 RepID=A0AAE1T2G8_9SOLA|nr:hypothetical protein RND71_002117 [Anisodus tanguticus]
MMIGAFIIKEQLANLTKVVEGLTKHVQTHKMLNFRNGARKITLFGLAQIGCIPEELKKHSTLLCVDSTNKVVQLFNKNLKALVDDLNTNLPDAQFIYINIFNVLDA